MNTKRIFLLVFTILWYACVIALVASFVTKLVTAVNTGVPVNGIGFFLTYFVLTMVLSGWQILITVLVARLYGAEAYVRGGGGMSILGMILFVLFAPLTLIWHFFTTFKHLWWLIRYNPED